jgi:hypothetical protein
MNKTQNSKLQEIFMRKIIGICGILFALLNANGFLYGQITSDDLPDREGIKAGEVFFHSALKGGAQFDSNIYLTDENETYDVITLISPSAGFYLPLRDNSLSMEYEAGFNIFDRFPENNHTDHKAEGIFEINLTDYKVSLEDLYRRFTDRSGTEDINRVRQQVNDFKTGISTAFEQLEFALSYTNRLHKYLTDNVIFDGLRYKDKDSITHILDFEGGYAFSPKTTFLYNFVTGFVDYYKSSLPPDSYYIEALAGIKGEWTPKTTVNLRGGVKYQSYENSELIHDDDYFNFIARGGIDYSMSEDDILKMTLERGTYESRYRDMNYYELNSAGFDYEHKYNKWAMGLFGHAQLNRYPNESTEGTETAKRKDKFYSLGLSLRYDVRKWLSCAARYEYLTRDSNLSTFDYINHLTTLRAVVGF